MFFLMSMMTTVNRKDISFESRRVTDSTFYTNCRLDIIRANQIIQNKLLSNLARTDGLLVRVQVEFAALQSIEAALSKD